MERKNASNTGDTDIGSALLIKKLAFLHNKTNRVVDIDAFQSTKLSPAWNNQDLR